MSLTKKNLFDSIYFVLIGLVSISLLTWLINFGVRNSVHEQTYKVNLVMSHKLDPEIAIFGSSVSEVGIDPRIITSKTKKSCYNLSINGTRFSQYKCLINEFNESSSKNEVVVLVETYFSFEPIDRIASIDYYLAHLQNENVYQALYNLDPELIWKAHHIPFYQYIPSSHIYYKNSIIGWKNILKGRIQTDSLQGYSPVNKEWELDADMALKAVGKFEIQIEKDIVKEYEKNILEMHKKGKKVVIVLTPMFSEKFKLVTNLGPLINTLKEVAARTNSTLIDFSRSKLCDDKSNFYNSSHLNYKGSKIFSDQLGDSLNYYLVK